MGGATLNIAHQNKVDSSQQTTETIHPKQAKILEIISKNALTPWEISDITGIPVYQIRPRLTELEDLGAIEIIGRKFQERTNRNESIYVKARKPGQLEFL